MSIYYTFLINIAYNYSGAKMYPYFGAKMDIGGGGGAKFQNSKRKVV